MQYSGYEHTILLYKERFTIVLRSNDNTLHAEHNIIVIIIVTTTAYVYRINILSKYLIRLKENILWDL